MSIRKCLLGLVTRRLLPYAAGPHPCDFASRAMAALYIARAVLWVILLVGRFLGLDPVTADGVRMLVTVGSVFMIEAKRGFILH